MVRTRVAMPRQDNLRLQVRGATNGRFEVVYFKPEQHAISVREVWIADGTVVMLRFPFVQLKHQFAFEHETFIFRSAVAALTPEETLIPPTAGLNVTHANERLWMHR
jgi:hypothetical protein